MADVFLFSLSLGITLLGLLGSWRVLRRRGLASGMRGVAWSLVPMAAYLTGFTAWAADLVFSPVKWAGAGILGLAFVLYLVSGVMLRRGAGDPGRVRRPGARKAVAERSGSSTAKPSVEQPQARDVDPDLADIENILRRRGIS
ncbi:MAG: hypothetical protein JWO67_3769 [Streptosporangiaceae bacterium]|jgi:hypothetical protein|nr:hypothetical protein [Streptosporangiaceae bacterium]